MVLQTRDRDASGGGSDGRIFLPDLCSLRVVFVVVIVGELLAFVLTLAQQAPGPGFWNLLSLVSLLVQWVALVSTALLCVIRRWLIGRGDVTVALVAFGVVLVVVATVSEVAYRLVVAGYAGDAGEHLGFVVRNSVIAAIVTAVVLRYLYVQHQWQRNVEAESRARVEALQARIRPHFFFNSMNTIASLTRSRPDLAETAVESMAQLFRATLADERTGSLGSEFELVERYLDIERLRLGERLDIEWDIAADVPRDVPIPPLTLQPLVENAIYHGIEPLPQGGRLRVQARRSPECVMVSVTNPLPPGGTSQRAAGNRIALANTAERLAAALGRRAALEAGAVGEQYRVTLTLPCEESPA